MKIHQLKLHDFMVFQDVDVRFSPNINIICGENGTGKTALLKVLYSFAKSCDVSKKSREEITKEKFEGILVSKLQGVFRPDKDSIGRLVYRRQGSGHADVEIWYDKDSTFKFGFGNRQEKHIDIATRVLPDTKVSGVYIPPKEIISSTENFTSLYADYHIAFEETYYDLARLLERPLKKGANTTEQNAVLKSFEEIVDGNIIQRDKSFYLHVKGSGEFEMGLVSEGYRKLATIMYLILSGSLSKDDLFFDLARRYSHIETLDRDILHTFIERIEIGEKILPDGLTIAGPRTPYRQSIRIFYRFIGEIAKDPVRNVTRVANL